MTCPEMGPAYPGPSSPGRAARSAGGRPLRAQVLRTLRKYDMIPPGCRVLCAVSGGRDSMALLGVLEELSREGGFTLAAAHFNHRLRPTADRDEALVRDWCRERGIPFYRGEGDVAALARKEGRGVEDAGRRLRYRFLEETARRAGALRIATAHHREDNAETVLLHLLRGSGLNGLGGIAPVRGRIVRPLLEAGRAEIEAYVAENSIPYADDESNFSPGCDRNRLRLEIMPELEALYPGCGARIAAAAELLREDEAHMARRAAELLPPDAPERGLPVKLLREQDPALRRRLTRLLAAERGVSLDRASVEAALALPSGGCADLNGGLWARRDRGRLFIEPSPPLPEAMELRPGEQVWGSWRIVLTDGAAAGVCARRTALSREKLDGPLTVRPWDGTGRFETERGSRSLKRLFTDAGVPPFRRRGYPALYLGDRRVAVPGVAAERSFLPERGGGVLTVDLYPI